MKNPAPALLTVADAEALSIDKVHDLYRAHVNSSQVTLMTSFGFGRELVDHAEGAYLYMRDKPPEGFQPEYPLSLEEEEATEGKRLKWKLGDLHELREGWRMFAYGEYRSNGEFLKAYNKKFGTTYTKGNFAMQFTQRWQLKLGIAESEIRRAKTRMTERRNGNLEMDTSDDF